MPALTSSDNEVYKGMALLRRPLHVAMG